jgi:hypothetical protein
MEADFLHTELASPNRVRHPRLGRDRLPGGNRLVRLPGQTDPGRRPVLNRADNNQSRRRFSVPCPEVRFRQILACLTPPFAMSITIFMTVEADLRFRPNAIFCRDAGSVAPGPRVR